MSDVSRILLGHLAPERLYTLCNLPSSFRIVKKHFILLCVNTVNILDLKGMLSTGKRAMLSGGFYVSSLTANPNPYMEHIASTSFSRQLQWKPLWSPRFVAPTRHFSGTRYVCGKEQGFYVNRVH